jgi:hypothetical protein
MVAKRAQAIVKRKAGILLDLSLGGTPQPNSVTCAELRMNPLKVPFPLPTASVHTCVATHILEFVDPTKVWRWFDELHRVMRPGGTVYFSGPYGGDESVGWVSDPSHRVRITETTFAWLDPRFPFAQQHGDMGRKQPKPWHVLQATRAPGTHGTTSYQVVLRSQGVGKPKAPK